MNGITRRRFLAGGLLGTLVAGRAGAQSGGDREHRINLDLPILSEEPAAVPIGVGIEHPMEPEHFIRAIEIRADNDPVPDKGGFALTPANGRAWVAYQMRSGAGGQITATVECSKHGRFTMSQSLRVVEGGCATGPAKGGRERAGNPILRLPRSIRPGEVIEVRAKLDHNSYTGLALKGGKYVRELPEFFVKQMLVYFEDRQISEFRMTSAVSPNPLIRFPVKVARAGTLRIVFVNSEGQRWEVSEALRV